MIIRALYNEDISSGEISISAFAPNHRDLHARMSICLKMTPANLKLASRLCAAIDAGKAFTDAKVAKDVNGHEFITFEVKVVGRTLNADLKRLGF